MMMGWALLPSSPYPRPVRASSAWLSRQRYLHHDYPGPSPNLKTPSEPERASSSLSPCSATLPFQPGFGKHIGIQWIQLHIPQHDGRAIALLDFIEYAD